jgi:hypothetical protein
MTKLRICIKTGESLLHLFHIAGAISQTHDKQGCYAQNPRGQVLLYLMDYLATVWLEQVIGRMQFHF